MPLGIEQVISNPYPFLPKPDIGTSHFPMFIFVSLASSGFVAPAFSGLLARASSGVEASAPSGLIPSASFRCWCLFRLLLFQSFLHCWPFSCL